MTNLKVIIQYIKDFYRYAGNSMFLLFFINLISGAIELIGIGLLLPILNIGFGGSGTDQISILFNGLFQRVGFDPTLQSLLILLVCVFMLKAAAVFSTKYFSSVIATNLKGTLQKTLTNRLANVSYTHFTTLKSGWLNNILMKESANFTQGFLEFSRIQTTLVYIAVYSVTAGILRLDLMIILFCLSIVFLAPMRILMRKVRATSKNLTQRSGSLSTGFIEFIDNFIYAKATGSIHGFKSNIKDKIYCMNKAEKRLLFFSAFISSLTEPVAVIALAVLVYTQVVIGGSQLSEVMILGLLIHRIVGQIMLLQGQYQRFNSTFGSIDIVNETLDEFKKNQEHNGTVVLDKIGDIEFENVCFSHGDQTILNDITLIIPHNKMIGIVGPSGSGKTTLFYLLTGLLSPDSGVIKANNIDYATLEKFSLREKVGYVSQTPAMIDGTLLENINFGTYDAHDPALVGKVKAVMQQAGLEEFINDLEKQTGERGVQLSGGQKQRVAIARELLRDTDILILDEATSALDTHSDQKIQDTLANLKGQKTIVIISHRATNIEKCDQVYHLENGKIKVQ